MRKLLATAHRFIAALKAVDHDYNVREEVAWDNVPDEDAWWSVIDGGEG